MKEGRVDKRYSNILREEQDDRFLADYDVSFSPEESQVRKRIDDAESFLNEMLRYLES